ncbi:hypothetical protein [Frondihabitans cladoniiphilus]
MTTYTVTAERSGKWWVLQALEVPGALSQVARLAQADEIKEAISFVAGMPVDEVEIRVLPVLPLAPSNHLDRARVLQAEAARVEAEASLELRAAIDGFIEDGLSLRDIGWVLGLSHQRVHQIVNQAPAKLPSTTPRAS